MTTKTQRAQWLGSTALTALVRCPCGARLYLSQYHWGRRSFAVCDDCKAAILYASLEVVDPGEVEDFVEMIINREREREAFIAELARELRRFVSVYDTQPEWLWSPATQRFVRAVKPRMGLLGAGVGSGGGRDVATPEEAGRGAG